MAVLTAAERGTLIEVWVIPRSSRPGLFGVHDGRLRARVAAPPEHGKANAAVQKLLEEAIGAPVELVSGISSRAKVFVAVSSDVENVRRRLGL
jgi:hypothetical protein